MRRPPPAAASSADSSVVGSIDQPPPANRPDVEGRRRPSALKSDDNLTGSEFDRRRRERIQPFLSSVNHTADKFDTEEARPFSFNPIGYEAGEFWALIDHLEQLRQVIEAAHLLGQYDDTFKIAMVAANSFGYVEKFELPPASVSDPRHVAFDARIRRTLKNMARDIAALSAGTQYIEKQPGFAPPHLPKRLQEDILIDALNGYRARAGVKHVRPFTTSSMFIGDPVIARNAIAARVAELAYGPSPDIATAAEILSGTHKTVRAAPTGGSPEMNFFTQGERSNLSRVAIAGLQARARDVAPVMAGVFGRLLESGGATCKGITMHELRNLLLGIS